MIKIKNLKIAKKKTFSLVTFRKMFYLLLNYGPTNDLGVNLKTVLENRFYQQYNALLFIKFHPIVIDQYLIE